MKSHRYIAMLVLMAFIFTTIAPVGALYAADPTVTIPDTGKAPGEDEDDNKFADLTAGQLPTTMKFTVNGFATDIDGNIPSATNTKVLITFPKEIVPQKDLSAPPTYTVSGQNVTIAKTTNGQEISVNVKIADTAMATGKNMDFGIKIGDVAQPTITFPMQVKAASIDLKGSTDPLKPRTEIGVVKENFSPAPPTTPPTVNTYTAVGTINLYDAFGNPSTTVNSNNTTDALYIWVENSGKQTAEITDMNGFDIEKIEGKDYYRIKNITSANLSFKIKSKADLSNQVFTIKLAKGPAGISKVESLATLQPLTTTVDFSLATVIIEGKADTHASIATPNRLIISTTTAFNRTGKVIELKLPAGFKTNKDNPATGRVPITNASEVVNIIGIPDNAVKPYKEGFELYVDGELYHPTEYTCSIDVQPAPLKVKIDNSLDFRHGTADPTTTKLDLSVSGMDQVIAQKLVVTLPAKMISGDTSPITPNENAFPAGVSMKKLNAEGKEEQDITKITKYQVTFADLDLTQKTVKLSIPITVDSGIVDKPYDQKLALTVDSLQSGGKLFEQAKIDLRYKVTDAVVNTGGKNGSMIGALTKQDVETTAEGKKVYFTTTTLSLNDSKGAPCDELNGRNLYVWVTTANGTRVDEFNITYEKPANGNDIVIKNPELSEVEGSAVGVRNVFKVMNATQNPEELLGMSEIPIKISTRASGNYQLKMATGRDAAEAFNAETGKFISVPFTIIGDEQVATLTVQNDPTHKLIYHNPEPGAPNGTITYQVDNVVLKNDATGYSQVGRIYLPDLTLPDGTTNRFEVNGKNYIQFDKTNKVGRSYIGTAALTKTPKPAEGVTTPVEYKDGFKLVLVDINTDDEGVVTETETEIKPPLLNFNGLIKVSTRKTMPITLTVGVNGGQPLVKATPGGVVITPKENVVDQLKDKELLVWVTKKGKTEPVTTGVTLTKAGTPLVANTEGEAKGKYPISGALVSGTALNLQLTMADLGDYDLHTQVMAKAVAPPVDPEAPPVTFAEEEEIIDVTSFKVVETPPVADTWSLQLVVDDQPIPVGANYNLGEKLINKSITVKATLVDKDQKTLPNQKVVIEGVGLSFSPLEANTDANGVVTFVTKPTQMGSYSFSLSAKDGDTFKTKTTLTMTVKDELTPPTGDYYELQVVKMSDAVAVDSRAFAYLEVFDKDGDQIKVTSNAMAQSIIRDARLRYKPDSSRLNSDDVYVSHQGSGIEIAFTPDWRGSYEVVVTTNGSSGDVVTLDFVAKEQGKIVDMKLSYDEDVLGLGETSSRATLLTYDAEGVAAEKLVTSSGVTIYYTGSAVESMDRYGAITVRDRDSYIGSTITVHVLDSRLNLSAEYSFEVKEYSSSNGNNNNNNNDNSGLINQVKDIMIWDTIGGVSRQNRFEFYLVNENGFKTQLKGGQMSVANGSEATVSVASRPYNSTVTASIPNNARSLEQGENAYLDLYCNKEGTVKLDITLKIYNPETSTTNWKRYDYFRKRVEIEIGKGDAVRPENDVTNVSGGSNSKKTTVAMFIGSKQYTVNGGSRELDTSPFVIDNRTMIPVRALGDSLGATTTYDEVTQKVTIIHDGRQVIMELGSNTIQTAYGPIYSDVPPMAQDNRTFIPLRAAAEALGCQVSQVTNIDGKVIGAIFTK